VIGVGRDAELAGSLRGRGAPNIITVGIEPSEALFLKQIDRAPTRLFVNAHVGDGIEPDLCDRLDGAELGQVEATRDI
jgi:hypothetical protein